jgi:bacteriocin-like protein
MSDENKQKMVDQKLEMIHQMGSEEKTELSEEALNNVSGGAKFNGKVYLTNPDSITVQVF